ncbi:protease inhibitor I42 family protein [Hazenella coriacea]|nr:protease inhibitor I42 family protein [Hazenella coriacea]
MLILNQTDHGKTIQLKLQDRIQLKLTENPSTGYTWLEEITPRIDIVKLEHEEIVPNHSTSGGQSTHQWIFQAVKPGRKMLRFVYQRPWVKSVTGQENVFEISIVITNR